MLNTKRLSKSLIAIVLISTIILSAFITTPVTATTEDTISIEMRNADIRDVLSAFGLNMNKNIIYTGDATHIDVSIQNVPQKTALEYILKSVGYAYIEDDNAIIVGDRATLSRDFSSNLSISSFRLKYITSDVIASQIESLDIPVKFVTLDNNQKGIWIQGFSNELTKVNELINMLDRPENASADLSGTALLLTPINTNYINAEVANDLLRRVGINTGIVLDSNPMIIWAYGDSATITQVQNIIKKIDIPANAVSNSFEIAAVKLTYLSAEEIISILTQMSVGVGVDVISFERSLKRIWLAGGKSDIAVAKEIIKAFDIKDLTSDGTIFVYDTVHITAKELKTRLEVLELPNVTINYLNYPEFSRDLIVYCPQDFKVYVLSYIHNLDVMTEKIKVPIDFSTSPGGKETLKNRLKLLVELTGIPSTSFTISDNVSRDTDGHHYVLYVQETPENVKLLKDYIIYIDTPLTDGLN